MKYKQLDINNLPRLSVDLSNKIYFLYKEDKIVYIGKSRNIISRLGQHLMDSYKDFDSYSILDIKDKDYNIHELESFYILRYKPKYNIQYNELNKFKYDNINFPQLLTNE